ncbi:hypothetical protein B0H11DRAFT_2240359 [Mycena galericulata]|nr:hypothetical protein B0H11DRAFT_2240359 [Mycena galericulata]
MAQTTLSCGNSPPSSLDIRGLVSLEPVDLIKRIDRTGPPLVLLTAFWVSVLSPRVSSSFSLTELAYSVIAEGVRSAPCKLPPLGTRRCLIDRVGPLVLLTAFFRVSSGLSLAEWTSFGVTGGARSVSCERPPASSQLSTAHKRPVEGEPEMSLSTAQKRPAEGEPEVSLNTAQKRPAEGEPEMSLNTNSDTSQKVQVIHVSTGKARLQIDSLEAENYKLKEYIMRLKTFREDEKQGLEATIHNANQVIEEWKIHAEGLETILSQNEGDQDFRDRIALLEEKNQILMNQIEEQETDQQLHEHDDTLRAQLQSLEAEYSQLKRVSDSDQNEKKGLDETINNIEAENSILRDELKNFNVSYEEQKKKLADFEAENSDLQIQVKDLSASWKQQKENFEHATAEKEKLEHDVSVLATEQDHYLSGKEALAAIEAENSCLQNQLKDLKDDLVHSDVQSSDLQTRVKALEASCEEQNKNLENATTENDKLKQDVLALEAEQERHLAEKENLMNSLQDRGEDLEEHEGIITELNTKITEQEELVTTMVRQTEELEKAKAKSAAELETRISLVTQLSDEKRRLLEVPIACAYDTSSDEVHRTANDYAPLRTATLQAQEVGRIYLTVEIVSINHSILSKEQNKLREKVESLETLNSELENARENKDDDIEHQVTTEVETRVAAAKEKIRAECEAQARQEALNRDSHFAQAVRSEALKQSTLDPMVQLARKELEDATREVDKRRAEMECEFIETTKINKLQIASLQTQIQELEAAREAGKCDACPLYIQKWIWTVEYVQDLKKQLAALTGQARGNGAGPDIEMTDVNTPSRPSGQGSSAPLPNAAPEPKPTQPSRGSSSSTGEKTPFIPSSQSGRPAAASGPTTQSSDQSTSGSSSSSSARPAYSSEPTNTGKKEKKVVSLRQPKLRRDAEEGDALVKFRTFAQRKLGIKKDMDVLKLLDTRATPKELEAFGREPPVEPALNATGNYPLDMDVDDITKSPWNLAVGEVLIAEFFKECDEAEGDKLKIDAVKLRKLWGDRLKNLRKCQRQLAIAAKDPKYLVRVAEEARRTTNRTQLLSRRKHSGQLAFDKETQKLFAILFRVLDGQVMSSDEELGDRKRKTCRVLRKDWRAKLLINIFKWLDYHADHNQLTSSGVRVGTAPHPRRRLPADPDTTSPSPYVRRLPSNLYDPIWIATLTPAQLDDLNVQDPITLPEYVLTWPTNEKFEADVDDRDEYWRPSPKA